jgi:hypothetical protein
MGYLGSQTIKLETSGGSFDFTQGAKGSFKRVSQINCNGYNSNVYEMTVNNESLGFLPVLMPSCPSLQQTSDAKANVHLSTIALFAIPLILA